MPSRLLRALALLLIATATQAVASGARWVTGQPYYYPEGNTIVWYTDSPQYFTDSGDLSAYVDNAAANAIVAAAAGVWTIPTSRLNLLYGGALAEHAGEANVYPTSTGLVFPADVQSSNYLAVQIAVLYDSDGAITDMMLGQGASDPFGCRQNAVTESVDSISTSGKIQHAILVLNGRCTGPDPDQQLQLQYQLMRAFGRVVGLGWSQTNDNVFTGNPTPTYNQALYWPIMHPIDVICGPYTYLCMPQPFTLRDDDISGLGLLYPVWVFAPPAPGKTDTLARGGRVTGKITFPNGQGMQGVNVVIHRLEPSWAIPEAWESTSGVSGYLFRRSSPNPVNGSTASPTTNMGTPDSSREGYYEIFRVPLYDWEIWQNLILSTQPINPLYVGQYAVGPYDSNSVEPSGPIVQQEFYVTQSYSQETINFPITDAATGCQTTQDGIESAPTIVPSQGWWTDNLCAYGHTAWSTLPVKANRSLTVEVTALDEQSFATSAKTMPVIGAWNVTDALGTLPTVGATAGAFNNASTGMTALAVQSMQPEQLRIAIADQRGDGRPDYAYQARVLYADAIAPASVPASGGVVTITGMGFRAGNAVSVNGVSAAVLQLDCEYYRGYRAIASYTWRQHCACGRCQGAGPCKWRRYGDDGGSLLRCPYAHAEPYRCSYGNRLHRRYGLLHSASYRRRRSYSACQPEHHLTATGATAIFGACAAATCTLVTDATGTASTTIVPQAAGTVTLTATGSAGTVTDAFTAAVRVRTITAVNPTLYVASGAAVVWSPQVGLSDNSASSSGVLVNWSGSSDAMIVSPASSTADAQSIAQTQATTGPLASGAQAGAVACAWIVVCTNFSAIAVDASQWQLTIVSGEGQSIPSTGTLAPVVLRVTDAASHPVAGASVEIYQALDGWEPPCPDHGRCPVPPVYGTSTTTAISTANGLVTIIPLQLSGVPGVTNIAAATGPHGFVSLALQQQP